MTSRTASYEAREKAHRADIQGLRAVAVLSVLFYHADASLLPGGFVGVDIFFVISGFLITGILLREIQRGEFSIAGFYERRIRRLFPALFVVLAAVLAAGIVLLDPHEFAELSRTTLSAIFFVSNFDFYSLSGYFDGEAARKPLLHTWSLAVEEQFYIVFPIFLAVVSAWLPKRLMLILVCGTVLALAFSAWGAFEHAKAAFFLTPFRVFELSLGAALAVHAPSVRAPQLQRDAASLIGIALIAGSLILLNDRTPFPGFAALVPCAGSALILYAGIGGRSLVGGVLSLPVLTFFGAISYSLYLWHWPILSFARHYFNGTPEGWQTALLMIAAVLAATASWKFIEQPVLERRLPRIATFASGASAMACFSAFAAAVLLTGGLPSRFSPRALELFAAADDYNHRREECHSTEWNAIPYGKNCLFGAKGAAPSMAIWGDSSGAEFVVALGELMARRGEAVMEITSSGCPPSIGYALPDQPGCIRHNEATLEALLADARIRTVVVTANFSRYPAPDQPRFRAGVTESVERLVASGRTVVLSYPMPNLWFEVPSVLGLRANRGESLAPVGIAFDRYEEENSDAIAFLDALTKRTGAIPFRTVETLCDDSFCPAWLPETGVLYFNANHVSVTGARRVAQRFPFSAIPPPTTAEFPRPVRAGAG